MSSVVDVHDTKLATEVIPLATQVTAVRSMHASILLAESLLA